jgi:hypothetical protein
VGGVVGVDMIRNRNGFTMLKGRMVGEDVGNSNTDDDDE